MIFYDFKRGLNQAQSFERLTQDFGDLASSRATVFNWFVEFKRGRTSFEDEERSGRLSTAVTENTTNAVEKMVRENAHLTYKDIEASLRIGSGSVAKILHTYLRISKVSSLWVPHSLTDGLKVPHVEWCRQMLRSSTMGTLSVFLRTLQVTKPGFTSIIQKQSISCRSGCSLMMVDLSK